MFPKQNSFILQFIFNLIPLFGIAFFHWNAFALLYSYWLESLAISFFNGIKILGAAKSPFGLRLLMAIKFWALQIGMLLFYFIFLVAFIGMEVKSNHQENSFGSYLFFSHQGFRYAMWAMFFTKCIELIMSYFVSGNYKKSDVKKYYYWFNSRLIFLHIVIIFGFFSFRFLSKQLNAYWGLIGFACIFVLLKSAIDYFSVRLNPNIKKDELLPYI